MYISKSKTKYGTHYVSISKGVRDTETKKVKKIMIKSYGTHNLDSKESKKALKLAEKELAEMIKFEESAKCFTYFRDFVANQELTLYHKNVSYIPYLYIFNELKLPDFFKKLTKDSKLEYDFSDIIFYQVLGRLFNPASKLEVAKGKDDFLHNYQIKEIIIVADRGLNSKDNLKMIRDKGLNYIVGSKCNSVPDQIKEKKFDLTWTITSKKDAKYKSGYITDTRLATHKGEK